MLRQQLDAGHLLVGGDAEPRVIGKSALLLPARARSRRCSRGRFSALLSRAVVVGNGAKARKPLVAGTELMLP